ncbi:MAG: type II toxin-antitoxin system RelE family toxin, partial [Mycobacteriales bacterium]
GLDTFAIDPHTANQNVTSIKGEDGLLRLRIGNYRVMYTIIDDELVILAIKVDHRSQIYKDKR